MLALTPAMAETGRQSSIGRVTNRTGARVWAAAGAKLCGGTARDYYSGFYFEPNEDGRLCVDRDRLLSRTGAKCSLSDMSQLVAVSGGE